MASLAFEAVLFRDAPEKIALSRGLLASRDAAASGERNLILILAGRLLDRDVV